MDEKKLLYDAILGGRDELFAEIAPTYHMWLHEALKTHNSEDYLSNDEQLINDFYRWLNENGHHNIIAKIDRRSGEDRRGEARPGSGRREEDHTKFKQSADWLSGSAEASPARNEPSNDSVKSENQMAQKMHLDKVADSENPEDTDDPEHPKIHSGFSPEQAHSKKDISKEFNPFAEKREESPLKKDLSEPEKDSDH